MEVLFAGPWGPLLIGALRLVDVSMATMRLMLSVRGQKHLAALIGFLEVTIWITAVGQAMKFLDSPLHIMGYALGFSLGTFVGLSLESRLAMGHAMLRVISPHGGVEIAEALRERGFGVTEFAGQGRNGRVEVVLAVMRRREVASAIQEVRFWDPDAFVLVEEPRSIERGRLREPGSRLPSWTRRELPRLSGRRRGPPVVAVRP